MTPTSTNYVIPAGITGYESSQSINPSELNLWRVISKNADGSVDVVSEYVSSEKVTFKGKTGYLNYVGVLNQIASQYTNEKYVQNTRHMGYNGQTEYITDTSMLVKETAPWTKSTSLDSDYLNCNESVYLCGVDEQKGAGDVSYEKDYQLVSAVYGNIMGKNSNGTISKYWLSSRLYSYYALLHYGYRVRNVAENGTLNYKSLYLFNELFEDHENGLSIRPVLTLKSNIDIWKW